MCEALCVTTICNLSPIDERIGTLLTLLFGAVYIGNLIWSNFGNGRKWESHIEERESCQSGTSNSCELIRISVWFLFSASYSAIVHIWLADSNKLIIAVLMGLQLSMNSGAFYMCCPPHMLICVCVCVCVCVCGRTQDRNAARFRDELTIYKIVLLEKPGMPFSCSRNC
jgi:hypothetical protein